MLASAGSLIRSAIAEQSCALARRCAGSDIGFPFRHLGSRAPHCLSRHIQLPQPNVGQPFSPVYGSTHLGAKSSPESGHVQCEEPARRATPRMMHWPCLRHAGGMAAADVKAFPPFVLAQVLHHRCPVWPIPDDPDALFAVAHQPPCCCLPSTTTYVGSASRGSAGWVPRTGGEEPPRACAGLATNGTGSPARPWPLLPDVVIQLPLHEECRTSPPKG